MHPSRRTVALATCLTAITACGYSSPGSGTQTLEVQALLHYSATDVATTVQITVNKNGVAVANPIVTLTDGDNGHTFSVVAQGSTTTNLVTQLPGYHRRMHLSVVSGSDNLQAQIEGPGAFTLSSPRAGQNVSQNNGLDVSWQTEDGVRADMVNVTLTNNSVANSTHDSGDYSFGPSQLQIGSDKVLVTRVNKLVPAGGAGTSLLQSEYEVDVSFDVQG